MKILPRSIIFFLFFMLIRKEINIKRAHIAHGLKPSIKPKITVKRGRDRFLISTFPKKGIFINSGMVLAFSYFNSFF